jgi:hypothetical protein
VSSIDAQTGGFQFEMVEDEDEEGRFFRPVLKLHVSAHNGQSDAVLLPPGLRRDPAQISIETKMLEHRGADRVLDSWMTQALWEKAAQTLPADRSEGFDTSSLPPFTGLKIGLLSSTLVTPDCHKRLCLPPGCVASEPDAVRQVAPAPGLDPADWPASAPPPLSVGLEDAR